MDLDFNGTLFVNDDKDDDYVGFVFNYQSNKRFMLVAWKKQNETYNEVKPYYRAMSGIQIKVLLQLCSKYIAYLLYTIWQVVNSLSGPSAELRNALWKTKDTRNEMKTIWYDPNFVGWEYKKAYRWNLKYSADNGCMR